MSLLDTFALLFETEASDAADEVDRLADSLDDAGDAGEQAASGVDAANEAAAEGQEAMSGLTKAMLGVVAGMLSLQAISAAVFSQAIQTDEVGKFAETMGLAIAEVDAWGEAVVRNGGSADAFRGSIQSLNEKLGDFALTGGGPAAEVLGRLGVSALDANGKIRKVTDLLPELAGAFQNLTSQEAFSFGQRLGLDQGTILMLKQGRDAVEGMVEQQRQLGGRTQEGYEASAKFNDTLADTRRIFVGMADSGNQKILPFLTMLLEKFQDVVNWARDHEDVIVGFFIAVAAIITAVYLPAITAAAAATITAFAPLIAIGAIVAAIGVAFALLYEDVKAYLGGQESLVGNLAQKYEWFGKLLDATIAGVRFVIGELTEFSEKMFANMAQGVELLGSIFSYVFDTLGVDMEGFGDVALAVVDVIIAAFRLLGDVISTVLDFIASPIETTGNLLKGLGSSVKGWFSSDDVDVSGLEQQTEAALNIAASANTNPMVSSPGVVNSATNRSISQSNTFQTTVNASGMGPDEARTIVGESLADQLRNAQGQLDDGIAY